MAAKPAPHAHLVKLRHKDTGHVHEAWPVDAREQVKAKNSPYEYAPADAPLGAREVTVEEPPALPTIAEQLATRSNKDLLAVAEKAGIVIPPKSAKTQIIDALLPHIEGGAISMTTLADVLPGVTVAAMPPTAES